MSDNPYAGMEEGLAAVNRELIRWNRLEMQWKKNQISKIVKELLRHMKSISPVFTLLNPKIYFCGGSYEGLSVGDEGDYDVKILLELPSTCGPVLEMNYIKGFVKLKLTKLQAEFLADDDDQDYISTRKLISFMQSLLDRALNRTRDRTIKIGNRFYKIKKVQTSMNSPALKLTIVGVNCDFCIKMDFVPAFVFPITALPRRGFSRNPSIKYPDEFFLVPKPLPGSDRRRFLFFCLSLQQQEHETFYDCGFLKPTIRLMKCIKQELDIHVSSYIIKTLFLWELLKNRDPDEVFRSSLSYCLVHMLKRFYVGLKRKRIEDFWNPEYNLLLYFRDEAIQEFTQKIGDLIIDIEDDPSSETIYYYFLDD